MRLRMATKRGLSRSESHLHRLLEESLADLARHIPSQGRTTLRLYRRARNEPGPYWMEGCSVAGTKLSIPPAPLELFLDRLLTRRRIRWTRLTPSFRLIILSLL